MSMGDTNHQKATGHPKGVSLSFLSRLIRVGLHQSEPHTSLGQRGSSFMRGREVDVSFHLSFSIRHFIIELVQISPNRYPYFFTMNQLFVESIQLFFVLQLQIVTSPKYGSVHFPSF